MREIKFRAWHNVNKKFINFYESDLKMFENGQIYAGGMNVTDRITLLQYTGLKDCNDVELYFDYYVHVFFGKKYDSTVPIRDIYELANLIRLIEDHGATFEVYSNPYDNPELMKGENL